MNLSTQIGNAVNVVNSKTHDKNNHSKTNFQKLTNFKILDQIT